MGDQQRETERILKDVGAWLTGHFILTSGLHSSQYMQCQKVMQFPRYGLKLARMLCKDLRDSGVVASAVIGPALGAIHWEVYVAQALEEISQNEPIKALFAERPEGKFEIRRGIELKQGEKVIVVEDVTTTGGSAKQVVELVRAHGAEPVAVGAVVDRSNGSATFGLPFHSLIKLNIETYQPDACPLCKEGLPLVKPGSSKQLA